MNQLVQDRLNELNGRRGERQSIATGADGLGREREIVHQINQVGRPPAALPPPKRRRVAATASASTASTNNGERAPVVTSPISVASPSPRRTARRAQLAIPMDTTPPANTLLPVETMPKTFVAPFRGLARARPLRIRQKAKKVRNDPYAPAKKLEGKHARSWVEKLPPAKRVRTKFPYLGRHIAGVKRAASPAAADPAPSGPKSRRVGVAGMSGPRKRGLTAEDWQEAEEDAVDILPPSKRMPRAM